MHITSPARRESHDVDTRDSDRYNAASRRPRRILVSGMIITFLAMLVIVVIFIVISKWKNEFMGEENSKILDARSFLNNSRLHGIVHAGKYIRGITVLGSQLFVALCCYDSRQLNVYDTNNFTLIRNITIIRAHEISAIVASLQYNCLYVSDILHNGVYSYNLSDNATSSWSVGEWCEGLSLTSTHNVLVTLINTKQIKEYTSDGSLVREINLDSSIEGPRHSVELSSGQFVVSHGNSESLHRVCTVDSSGGIIQSYGGSEGSGVGQLNSPHNLALDSHGNVLIADLGNNRVVLLSPTLTHLGYINIPGHMLESPCALHLDLLTRRLYIGECANTGRVFVLTV